MLNVKLNKGTKGTYILNLPPFSSQVNQGRDFYFLLFVNIEVKSWNGSIKQRLEIIKAHFKICDHFADTLFAYVKTSAHFGS